MEKRRPDGEKAGTESENACLHPITVTNTERPCTGRGEQGALFNDQREDNERIGMELIPYPLFFFERDIDICPFFFEEDSSSS